MAPRPKFRVKPAVMKWILETSETDIDDLARKFRVKPAIVKGWVEGRTAIGMGRLTELAHYVKRPLVVFALDSPPHESWFADYRRMHSSQNTRFERETMIAIRELQYLKEVAADMMTMGEIDPAPIVTDGITTEASPEQIAARERHEPEFNDIVKSSRRNDPGKIYKKIRNAVESKNIMVFQKSFPLEDLRGASTSGRPSVILINSKDPPTARMFTLMHEYAHILLRKNGMCTLHQVTDSQIKKDSQPYIERWCNKFAAFFLMPRQEFVQEFKTLQKDGLDDSEIIEQLSKRFTTSQSASAIHAKDLGLVMKSIVDRILNFKDVQDTAQHGFARPNAVNKCLNSRGHKFVLLVLESLSNELITNRDAIDYLGGDLDHAKLWEKLT